MTYEEFRSDVLSYATNRPKNWRFGQAVFNYIDQKYKVARYVQFVENMDCFYDDSNVEAFMFRSYEVLNKQQETPNS